MSTYQDPSAARRRLRAELRAAREHKGLTQQFVADSLDWSLSKLLRIEAGSVGLSTTDLRALLSLYDIQDAQLIVELMATARESRRQPWWHEFQDQIRPQFAQLLGYETTANVFLEYAQILIPGPFQTPDYAAAVMKAARAGSISEEELRQGLELRIRRGQWLLNRDDVRDIVLLLDEFALLRPIGGPQVMAAQLDSLVELSKRDSVHVALLPLSIGEHGSLGGSFKLLQFDNGDNAVLYLSGLNHDTLVRDNDELVADFLKRFEQMRTQAITGDAARERIVKAAESFRD